MLAASWTALAERSGDSAFVRPAQCADPIRWRRRAPLAAAVQDDFRANHHFEDTPWPGRKRHCRRSNGGFKFRSSPWNPLVGNPKSRSENVAAGILACRRGRHLAARKNRPPVETLAFHHDFPGGDAVPPGWKPRLYVSQDGRRYHFQTGSKPERCSWTGERRPLACGVWRPAKHFVQPCSSHHTVRSKRVERRFRRAAENGTRATCAPQSTVSFPFKLKLQASPATLHSDV